MFDSLSNVLQQQPQGSAEQGYQLEQMNTAGIAGKLIAFGMQPKDAYVQAAQLSRQQEMGNIERQKQQTEQQQRFQFSQLADFVRSNPNVSNQELAAAALHLGVNPANVPAFVGTLGTQERIIEDKLRGQAPTIFTNRAGTFTGQRSADGAQLPIGNMNGMPSQPDIQSVPPPNMGAPAREMTEEQALQLAMAPAQPALAEQALQNEERDITDDFIDFANKYRPKKNEVPTLSMNEIHQRNFDKFREKKIDPALEAARNMDLHLNEILDASQIFRTGALGEQRLAAKQIGEYLGIANPQEVAAGELIRKASAKMVLDFAKQMPGVISDKDIKFLKEMVPTLSTTPEGNQQIIEYFKRLNDVSGEYAMAAERYFRERGNMNDFQSTFHKYYAKQPLFAKEIAEREERKNKAEDRKMKLEAVRKAGLL